MSQSNVAKMPKTKTIAELMNSMFGIDVSKEVAGNGVIITEIALSAFFDLVKDDLATGQLRRRIADHLGSDDHAVFATKALENIFLPSATK